MTTARNTSTIEPIDVHDMVVVHRVFRRELVLLPELLLNTRAGDVDRAAVVAGHARLVLRGLHLHHTSEDDLLWPALSGRAALSSEPIGRMQAQHAAVDELIDRLGIVLARWESEARPAVAKEAAALFHELRPLVIEHLDDEEQSMLPIAARSLTPEQWAAVGEAGVAKMSRAELPLMFGAVMEDATPSERRNLLRVVPLPARLLLRVWGSGHYRRYITKVRGRR